MVDQFKWLLKYDEVAFEEKKFKGKLAGKAYKYAKHIDGLIRVRMAIFIMAILVLYPVLSHYVFYEIFDFNFLLERLIFSGILIAMGLLFNKIRMIAIVIAVLPLLLILYTYLVIPGQLPIRTILFMLIIILFILSGIYHHLQLKKTRSELEATLIENHLIEE